MKSLKTRIAGCAGLIALAAIFALGLMHTNIAQAAYAPKPRGASNLNVVWKKWVYSFATDDGTAEAKNLNDDQGNALAVPAGCVVRVCHNTADGMTSGGAATVALGITGATTAWKAATAFNHADFTEDDVVCIQASGAGFKTAGTERVVMTIADAALTAGVLEVYAEILTGTDTCASD